MCGRGLRRSGRTAAASTATPCWNAQSACMCTMRTASTLSGRTCASATRVWLARCYGEVARQVEAAVEPLSHLVLMSPDDFRRVQRGEKASGSWASTFVRRVDGPGCWPAAAVARSCTLHSIYPFRHGAEDDARHSPPRGANAPGPDRGVHTQVCGRIDALHSYSSLVSADERKRVDVARTFPAPHHQEQRTYVPTDYSKIVVPSTYGNSHMDAL